MAHRKLTAEMRECLDNCNDCRAACLETVAHCLALGGHHASPAHIQLLLDCAEICATSAGFLARGSERHAETCDVCAEICDACAESCESMGAGDETMTRCAAACRQCADSCRKMAGVVA
jgi:hypothetical protein